MKTKPVSRSARISHWPRVLLVLGFLLAWNIPSSAGAAGPAVAAAGSSKAAVTRGLAIRVSGNHLVDGSGNTVQLRGVSISGLEQTAIQGWSPADPWAATGLGGMPDFESLKTWGINSVRLALNEASWLGLTCVDAGGAGSVVSGGAKREDAPGALIKADPGGNYVATVKASVSAATKAGLYVIIDLHWTAPGDRCPMGQNAMADADHSITFWSQIASAFSSYPNAIFELFNEPFLDQTSLIDRTPWPDLLNGTGTLSSYLTPGNPSVVKYTWHNAGMQQMLDAVRATGAKNVVLTSGLDYAKDLSKWLDYKPNDPLGQLGASWHAYPAYNTTFGSAAYAQPDHAPGIWSQVQEILAAGYPVVITEFGDRCAPGTTSAPFASRLLPWADANGVGYLGWTWDVWQNPSDVLITNAAGDPSPGYGVYVKAHYLCRAASASTCP